MAGLGLHIQVLAGACQRHGVGGLCGVFSSLSGGGGGLRFVPSGARSRRLPQKTCNSQSRVIHHHHHHQSYSAINYAAFLTREFSVIFQGGGGGANGGDSTNAADDNELVS